MKTRFGFVSNSSSQSFMAYVGVVTDLEKFLKFQEKIQETYQLLNYSEACNAINWCDDNYNHLYKPDEKYIGEKFVVVSENIDIECNDDGEPIEADEWEFSDRVTSIGGCTSERDGLNIIQNAYYSGRNG